MFAAYILHECAVLVPNKKTGLPPQSFYSLKTYSPYLSSVYKLSVYVRVRVYFAINVCVCESVEVNSLSKTQLRHSSVPSVVACFCSSSPLLFLRLPLPVLFHLRAYVAPPFLSPCRARWRCHRDGAGSGGGGIPAPGSAGRCFQGELAPSRLRTSAGFQCCDTKIRTRGTEDGRQRGSRRSDGR